MAVARLRVAVPVEFSTTLGFSDTIRESGARMLNTKKKKKSPWSLYSLLTNTNYSSAGRGEPEKDLELSVCSSLVANPAGDAAISSEQKVFDGKQEKNVVC